MGITATTGSLAPAQTTAPRGAADQPSSLAVGAVLGAVAAAASFAPSMLGRSHLDQALVTTGAAALAFGAGVGGNALNNEVGKHDHLTALETHAAIAGTAGAALIATRGAKGNGAQIARSLIVIAGTAAMAGAATIGTTALAQSVAPGSGLGRAGVESGVATAGAATAWYALAHRPMQAAAATRAAAAAADLTARDQPAFDLVRYQGIDAERASIHGAAANEFDLLPLRPHDTQQSRFLAQTTPATEIARVMGDARPVRDPKRIYVPVMSDKTPAEIAALVKQAVARAQTAAGRPYAHWRLYVSSGTGFVDPMAPEADEYGARGNVLSIGLQYGTKPSVQSAGEVPREKALHTAIVDALHQLHGELPADQQPTDLTEQGESLGAWGIADSYVGEGAGGPAAHGVAKQLLVGVPAMSTWTKQVLKGRQFDDTRTVGQFDSPEEFAAVPQADRDRLTTVLLSHYNDPVTKFELKSAFLRAASQPVDGRPTGMPPGYHYWPLVGGMQLAIDTKNGARVVPGLLGQTAHDYRKQMAAMESQVFHPGTTPEETTGISDSLAQSELARAKAPQLTLLPQTRSAATAK